MNGQPIIFFPSRRGAVVKSSYFTPLIIETYGRQVSYILYYDGRLNSTTECSNGPSCYNRMFKWGRERRYFLRRPLFEDRPWSDENSLQTLSWSYKNSLVDSRSGRSRAMKWKFWVVKASENISSTTYFVSDSCQVTFANFHKTWTKSFQLALQTLWMARKCFEH